VSEFTTNFNVIEKKVTASCCCSL